MRHGLPSASAERSIILNKVGEFPFDENKQQDWTISLRRIVELVFGVDMQANTRGVQKRGVRF